METKEITITFKKKEIDLIAEKFTYTTLEGFIKTWIESNNPYEAYDLYEEEIDIILQLNYQGHVSHDDIDMALNKIIIEQLQLPLARWYDDEIPEISEFAFKDEIIEDIKKKIEHIKNVPSPFDDDGKSDEKSDDKNEDKGLDKDGRPSLLI